MPKTSKLDNVCPILVTLTFIYLRLSPHTILLTYHEFPKANNAIVNHLNVNQSRAYYSMGMM